MANQTVLHGAGSGIGRATALLAADRGARVVASDLDAEAGGAAAPKRSQRPAVRRWLYAATSATSNP